MARYYSNLGSTAPDWKCECCEQSFLASDACITELSHISPITHKKELLYTNRKFCRPCADMVHMALQERIKEKVRKHRLENEAGQLALFS